RAQHARPDSLGLCRADPAGLRSRVAGARIAVRAVRHLCSVGAARLAVAEGVQKEAAGGGRMTQPMDSRRLAYLKALEIDVWERRGLAPSAPAAPSAAVAPGAVGAQLGW